MTFLKSGIFVAALFPFAALAEPPATPTPEATKVEAKLKPFARIETYTVLVDSRSGATPMFIISDLRLGVRYTEGIAHGQTTWKLKRPDGKIDFDVRDGFVGVTLPVGFTADFGRVRPKVVDDFGAWGRNGNSYGSMNAVHLGQTIKLPDAETEIHAYYGGDVQLFNGAANWKTAAHHGYAGEKPVKGEKAFVITAKATAMDSIKVAVSYAAESKSVLKVDGTDNTPGLVADMSQLSFSAGYDKDGIAGGLWYNKLNLEKPQSYTAGSKVDTIKTSSITNAEATDASVVGLGASVESTVFGLKDLLQTDDKLAFGGSYEMYGFKEDKNNYNNLTLSAGYLVGKLDFELNLIQVNAKEKNFDDAKGKKADSVTAFVLSSTMEL
jgi:hypothetical protein